ncbi:neural-cadherin-like [Penaeus monodon]|uniref:neural-cadherin-like n=1 Tax=Penaeus monodon TaxID=6687 RepID=UPI0018A754BD|nr:neural-cadherin-like [Penaeus monodon]
MLGTLTATDDDVWALGHGPPFNFSLAPSNPAHVKTAIRLLFDQRIDSGRGGAEVWTVGALDREEHRQLKVGVLLSDAGGLSAVHALTIIVDDINDNPMRPGAKTVYLWKTQGLGSEAPLGRVYVDDPDDWDGRDKDYAWAGHPHPLFTLHPATGHIVASGQLREGRCICPGGSFGSRCKIPARSFKGTGWAWVAPLPPCLPASLSFKVLTNRPRALLLYSGPLTTPATPPRSLLAIQLEDGRPRLIYEGRAGKVDLLVNTKVDDGAWHSIYAHFGTKGVVVMVDLCGRGWKDHDDQDDPRSSERNDHGTGDGHEHCLARAHWRNRKDRTRMGEASPSAPWLGVEPLQVGGMARTPSRPHASGGRPFSKLVTEGLDGCVAHLVVNSQVRSRCSRQRFSTRRFFNTNTTLYIETSTIKIDTTIPLLPAGRPGGAALQPRERPGMPPPGGSVHGRPRESRAAFEGRAWAAFGAQGANVILDGPATAAPRPRCRHSSGRRRT